MKRRSFLAMLGLAPVAAVAAPMPKTAAGNEDGLTMLDVNLGEYPTIPDDVEIVLTLNTDLSRLEEDVRARLRDIRSGHQALARQIAELAQPFP